MLRLPTVAKQIVTKAKLVHTLYTVVATRYHALHVGAPVGGDSIRIASRS